MIVRNEAHVIREAFESIRPYVTTWVIVDTGSTDGTQAVIADYFRAHQLPGELHERPWRDFGTNRTEALALAYGKADYIWVFDADDVLVGTPDLSALTADWYQVRFGPEFVYWRPQMFRGDRRWAYHGVVHEYAVPLESPCTSGRIGGDYHVVSRRLGGRNRSTDKYDRDRRLLERQLAEHPGDPRTTFYLAQSCFDAGDLRAALDYYTRRTALGGWAEETYYALFRRGVCLERLNEPWPACQAAYEAAARFHPGRAEPWHALARAHRLAGRYAEAYTAACRASDLPFPPDDALFVTADVYRWRSQDERAIAAYSTGRYAESLAISTRLLESPHVPESERPRLKANRDLAVERAAASDPPYPDTIVSRLDTGRRARRAPARVTLTMTTCKRRHLFERTVNAFLAHCQDVELIDRWIVIDDGSSREDRDWMAARYPFFEFIWKPPAERGHARSMNMLLDAIDSEYWIHLEDDWQTIAPAPYVTALMAVLEADTTIAQVMFNRNYGETLASERIGGGIERRTPDGMRYRVHQHAQPGTTEHAELVAQLPADALNVIYWPHYSLQPSMTRVSDIRRVGVFNPEAQHFEYEFASRYTAAGLKTGFLDGIHLLHIGRLTTERGGGAVANAYDLNDQPQFSPRKPVRRVRMTGAGAAAGRWRRQAREGGTWDGIILVDGDTGDETDYVAVLGNPGGIAVEPARTFMFPLSSGDARPPDTRQFIQVRNPGAYPAPIEWRIDRSWEQLTAQPVVKTRVLSAVRAGTRGSSGDRVFERLVEALRAQGVDLLVHEPGDADGLLPFQYAIAVEDESRADGATATFFDALVSECLCFYWGCPNLEAYVDPAVFIRLPSDAAEAARLMADAITGDAYALRADAIRREKRRLLDERQLVPTLARAIRGHEIASRLPVFVLNLDRRPDRWTTFKRMAVRHAGVFAARCERIPAVDGQALTLTPEIEHLFRGNDFNFRRGIVGCALSHLAIWRRVAASGAMTLVLEDDASFDEHFTGQLADVCGEIDAGDDAPDMVLLGYQTWTPEQAAALAACRGARLRPMDWSSYLGGGYGYLISPRGARRLLDLAERDGIQNGIDWFVMRKAAHLTVLRTAPRLVTSTLAIPGSSADSDIQHDMTRVALPTTRRSPHTRPIRVKLIGNWCPPEALCREWNRMSQGEFRWNDLEITWTDQDIDFYVIVNQPWPGEYYDPGRTIVIQMEPWCALPHQTWGVKTWGEWAEPDPARFLQVRRHPAQVTVAYWQLRSTYAELGAMAIEKSRVLSTICSSKYFDPGHIARVDFIKYVERQQDDIVRIDTFGFDNRLGFESYRGALPADGKEAGLLPYRYVFAAENNQERGYITEKLWEPILAESLCFYAGAPDAAEHVDSDAFVALDLSDVPRAFDTMRRAIASDEWTRRLPAIRRAKRRVLDELQFFPTLERVLQEELGRCGISSGVRE